MEMALQLTKKNLISRYPTIGCIYGDTNNIPADFTPIWRLKDPFTIATIYKKEADVNRPPMEWIGKITLREGWLSSDDVGGVIVATKEIIDSAAIQEKIGMDAYAVFGNGEFDVPKTCLATLPIVDEYTSNKRISDELKMQGIEKCLRIMREKNEVHIPIKKATIRTETGIYRFSKFIKTFHSLPITLQTPCSGAVPLYGLMEYLCVGKILCDLELLQPKWKSLAFSWVYNENKEIVSAKIAKLECASIHLIGSIPDQEEVFCGNPDPCPDVKWSDLLLSQKQQFLSCLNHCTTFLQPELLHFLCYRDGQFVNLSPEEAYVITRNIERRVHKLMQIYASESSTHWLRRIYLQKYSKLALVPCKISIPLRQIYTPLSFSQSTKRTRLKPEEQSRVSPEMVDFFLDESLSEDNSSVIMNLFSLCSNVLLQGSLGIGKSTLCQKFVCDWVEEKPKSLKCQFDVIYLLPVCDLNTITTYNSLNLFQFLAESIGKVIFRDNGVIPQIENQLKENTRNALFVFDGVEDASTIVLEYIHKLFHQDNQFYVLLTCTAAETERVGCIAQISILNSGFNKSNIEKYAALYVSHLQKPPEVLDSLLKALRLNANLQTLAKNPLTLQLLCHLWEENAVNFPFSNTSLYTYFVRNLISRYCDEYCLEMRIDHFSFQAKEQILQAFAKLSQQVLEKNTSEVSLDMLSKFAAENEIPQQILAHTGILRSKDGELTFRYCDASFKRFLAAYFISTQAKYQQVSFLTSTAWDSGYMQRASFLCGTIYANDISTSKNLTQEFFTMLCEITRNFDSEEDVKVIWTCVNECVDYRETITAIREKWPNISSILGTRVNNATLNSSLPLVLWIVSKGLLQSLQYICFAYGPSALHVLGPENRGVAFYAANNGFLHLLQWLHQQDKSLIYQCKVDGTTVMQAAAATGNLLVMQWLYEQDPSFLHQKTKKQNTVMFFAAGSGCVNTLEWLHNLDPQLVYATQEQGLNILHQASIRNKVKAMEWIVQHFPGSVSNCTKQGLTCAHFAASNRALNALQWLFEKNATLLEKQAINGYTAMHYASVSGSLGILQWMYEKNPALLCKMADSNVTVAHVAAEHGHLHILEWLYSQNPALINVQMTGSRTRGYGIMKTTCMHWAAAGGYLGMLKWLYERYPCMIRQRRNDGFSVMHLAAQKGHMEIVKWVYEKETNLMEHSPGTNVASIINIAAQSGNLELVAWFLQQKPLTQWLDGYLTDKCLEMIMQNSSEETELDLSKCREISDHGILALSKVAPQLRKLNIARSSLSGQPKLSNEALHFLGEGCHALTSLSIHNCYTITDEGFEFISKGCTSLQELYIHSGEITSKSLQYLSQGCPLLSTLACIACPRVSDEGLIWIARGCKRLKNLDVSFCHSLYTDAGICAIAECCPELVNLNVGHTLGFTNRSMECLSKKCPKLQALNISASNISDVGLNHLYDGCLNLIDLNLSDCIITDEGFRRINLNNLQSINLVTCTQITDLSLKYISQECHELQSIELGNSGNISDEGLTFLSRGCRLLENINVFRCKHVGFVVGELLQYCPNLKSVKFIKCAFPSSEVEYWKQQYPNVSISNGKHKEY